MAVNAVILELIVQDKNSTQVTSRLKKEFGAVEKSANKAAATMNKGNKRVQQSFVNMDKAGRGANQTLFSFGDIVNDAQQFQFGFAQGSRAIGNNIGFMAEQFSNVQARAGGFTNALKAMGSSLLGPGGIILGVNLAVTAVSLFGEELFSAKGDAEDLKNEIDELMGFLDDLTGQLRGEGMFGDDPFDLAQLGFQRGVIQDNIRQLEAGIERFGLSEDQQRRLEVLRGIGNLRTADQQRELGQLELQMNRFNPIVSEYNTLLEQQNEALKQVNDEIERQQRLQREVVSQQERISNRPTVPGQRPEDVIFDDPIDLGGVGGGMGEGFDEPGGQSIAGLQAELQQLEEQFKNTLSEETRDELRGRIQTLKGDINELTGTGEEGFKQNTVAVNMFGNAIAQAVVRGEELHSVLKSLAAQLASRAIMTGLQFLVGGPAMAGKSFFGTMFGFAGGTDGGFPGTGIVGERGPEMLVAPPMSSIITNENIKKLDAMRNDALNGAAGIMAMGSGNGAGQAISGNEIIEAIQSANIHVTISADRIDEALEENRHIKNKVGNG